MFLLFVRSLLIQFCFSFFISLWVSFRPSIGKTKQRRKEKKTSALLQIFYQPEHFYHKPQPVIKFFQTHSFLFPSLYSLSLSLYLGLYGIKRRPWIHFTSSRYTIFCVHTATQLTRNFAHWTIYFFPFFLSFAQFFSLLLLGAYYFMSYNRSINQSINWNRTF